MAGLASGYTVDRLAMVLQVRRRSRRRAALERSLPRHPGPAADRGVHCVGGAYAMSMPIGWES